MYAMLEEAAKQQKAGKAPSLPLWLSPTQVRLIPVSSEHLKFCMKVAEDIEKKNVRVDVDDREESVSKKIRDAEMEWIHAIVVAGSKEKKTGRLCVRFREERGMREMRLEELVKFVKSKTKGYPFRRLALPKLISKRPIFVG
jgi:threonyl-tRNA synthetase